MVMPIFPTLPGRTFPFTRSVDWQSLKHRSVSGKVTALQQWTAPIYHYGASYSFLRSAPTLLEWQTLLGFYNSVGGDAQLFQFTDNDDKTVVAQGFGTGDGVTTAFQLVRTLGGFVEPVYLPKAGFTVSVNGTPTVAFTESLGLITFTVAPGVGDALAWDGDYYWPCRFDGKIDFSKFAYQYWSLDALNFSTEKM